MCIRLGEFCFCCSTRVGTFFAAFVTALMVVDVFVDAVLDIITAIKKITPLEFMNIPLWLALAAISFALTAVSLIALAFLLLGIILCRPKYLLPWLVLSVVITFLLLFYEGFVVREVLKNSSLMEMPPQHSISLIVKIVLVIFGIYLWTIVYSFYVDLTRFSRVY